MGVSRENYVATLNVLEVEFYRYPLVLFKINKSKKLNISNICKISQLIPKLSQFP